MAITLNNIVTNDGNSAAYVPSSVTDACLVVFAFSEDVFTDNPITALDFGATALTLGITATGTSSGHSNYVQTFYLKNPGTASQTIAITGGEPGRTGFIALTLGGVDQTSPYDSTGSVGTGGGAAQTSISHSFTPTVDGMALTALGHGSTADWAPDVGQTSQAEFTIGATTRAELSSEAAANGVLNTHGYTGTAVDRPALVTAIFKEAAIGGQTVITPALASTLNFGAPSLALGAVSVVPPALGSTLAFGGPAVSVGLTILVPPGMASTLAFGAATIAPGVVSIVPPGVAATMAFGVPTATPGAVNVTPPGIAATTAFGSLTVAPGVITLMPTGLASALGFGTASIVVGSVSIVPPGIGSTLAFGVPFVGEPGVQPPGIATTLQFGSATIRIVELDLGQSYNLYDLDQYVPDAYSEEGREWLQKFLSDVNDVVVALATGRALLPIGYMHINYQSEYLKLGTTAKFEHSVYGIQEAIFCKFGAPAAVVNGAPVGFMSGKQILDWVVTNDISNSAPGMVVGLSAGATLPANGEFSWVQLRGANLQTVAIKAAEINTFGTKLFWSGDNEVSSTGPASARDLFATQIIDAGRDSTQKYFVGELLISSPLL